MHSSYSLFQQQGTWIQIQPSAIFKNIYFLLTLIENKEKETHLIEHIVLSIKNKGASYF